MLQTERLKGCHPTNQPTTHQHSTNARSKASQVVKDETATGMCPMSPTHPRAEGRPNEGPSLSQVPETKPGSSLNSDELLSKETLGGIFGTPIKDKLVIQLQNTSFKVNEKDWLNLWEKSPGNSFPAGEWQHIIINGYKEINPYCSMNFKFKGHYKSCAVKRKRKDNSPIFSDNNMYCSMCPVSCICLTKSGDNKDMFENDCKEHNSLSEKRHGTPKGYCDKELLLSLSVFW